MLITLFFMAVANSSMHLAAQVEMPNIFRHYSNQIGLSLCDCQACKRVGFVFSQLLYAPTRFFKETKIYLQASHHICWHLVKEGVRCATIATLVKTCYDPRFQKPKSVQRNMRIIYFPIISTNFFELHTELSPPTQMSMITTRDRQPTCHQCIARSCRT